MKLFKSASENGAIALKTFLGTLLLGGLLTGFTASAQATLIGQTVGCSVTTSTVNFDTDCSSETAVVQSPGPEFGVSFSFARSDSWSIDIEETSIRITQIFPDTTDIFASTDVVLSDLFWLGDPSAVITGFILSTDGVSGFVESDITIFDNAIDFDLGSSAAWVPGSSATITLITEGGGPSVSVPEPATLALFGLGLAGLGFARRRTAAEPAAKSS